MQGFAASYAELYGKAKHLVVKPGDKIPITGLDWRIVSAAGAVLKTPLPGGGRPNPLCAAFAPKEITTDPENAQSVGSVVTLGQFRAADLGDLLWNKEQELMCPNNPIGTIDLFMVTHHGLDQSNAPVLVHALEPRVAVMQNGTRKGAGTATMPTLRSSPGLEDIWQLHWAYGAGIEQNSAGVYIANIDDNATIAGILTAPPRGGGPGRGASGPGAGGPPAGAPGAAPAPPNVAPPAGAPPVAPPLRGASRGAADWRTGRPAGAARQGPGQQERVGVAAGVARPGIPGLHDQDLRPTGRSFTVTNIATGLQDLRRASAGQMCRRPRRACEES